MLRPVVSCGWRVTARCCALAVVGLLATCGPAVPKAWAAVDTGVVDVSSTPDRPEGEASISVDPLDPNLILVGANQVDTPPGMLGGVGIGPNGLVITALWSSRDGGRTWQQAQVPNPPLSLIGQPLFPPPPEFGEAGNVVIADQDTAWDHSGHAYYEAGSLQGVLPTGGDSLAWVWRSDDGGRSFGPATVASSTFANLGRGFQSGGLLPQGDRPWLAVDRSGGPRDGTVYLTAETSLNTLTHGAVFGFVSTDRGRTFGPLRRVDAGPNTEGNPRQFPVVDAAGNLYVVYVAGDATPNPGDLSPQTIMLARSNDGGQTFQHSVVDAAVRRIQSPDEAEPIYAETIAALAADPVHPGRLAVAWPNRVNADNSRILLRYTTNGGRTWSGRIDVANDPPAQANQHDHVALSYRHDGGLIVVWRDRRCCGGSWSDRFDVFARSFRADAHGRLHPGRTITLTSRPQPPTTLLRGLGNQSEYLGATTSRDGLLAAWDEMRGMWPDIVFRGVPLYQFDCAYPIGRIGASTLGPAALGRTRQQNRRAFPIVRSAPGSIDSFCLTDGSAIRVGYVRQRAVIAVTSSPAYPLLGVRAGGPFASIRDHLRSAVREQIGRATWYLVSTGGRLLLFEIRGSVVRAIGIADEQLLADQRARRQLLIAFTG